MPADPQRSMRRRGGGVPRCCHSGRSEESSAAAYRGAPSRAQRATTLRPPPARHERPRCHSGRSEESRSEQAPVARPARTPYSPRPPPSRRSVHVVILGGAKNLAQQHTEAPRRAPSAPTTLRPPPSRRGVRVVILGGAKNLASSSQRRPVARPARTPRCDLRVEAKRPSPALRRLALRSPGPTAYPRLRYGRHPVLRASALGQPAAATSRADSIKFAPRVPLLADSPLPRQPRDFFQVNQDNQGPFSFAHTVRRLHGGCCYHLVDNPR